VGNQEELSLLLTKLRITREYSQLQEKKLWIISKNTLKYLALKYSMKW
jgi:hypothetical protein